MYKAPDAKGLLSYVSSRLGQMSQEYDLLLERDLKHLANWSDKEEDVWLEAMWESVAAHHHKKCVTKFDSFKNMCSHLDKFWDLTMFGDIIKTKFETSGWNVICPTQFLDLNPEREGLTPVMGDINDPWLGFPDNGQKVTTLGHGLWAVYCIKLRVGMAVGYTSADLQPRAKVGMAVIQGLDYVPLAARGPPQ